MAGVGGQLTAPEVVLEQVPEGGLRLQICVPDNRFRIIKHKGSIVAVAEAK